MTKKEEIKYLKQQLKIQTVHADLAMEVLEPYKQKCTQRGARMQIMYEYIKSINPEVFGLKYPEEFDEYFDKDGVPLP